MNIQRPSRADGFALGVIATGAVSVAAAALTGIALRVGDAFDDDLEVRLPVHDVAAPDLSGNGIESAAWSAATIGVDAGAGAGWLLLFETALPALATIGVCAVAWWLGVSLIRARPFRRSMSWSLGAAAVLVILGGVLGQACGAFGRAIVVEELAAAPAAAHEAFWPFLLELDLAPVGWGFALALIAGAFQIGQRMQRDTEGLV